MPEAEFRFYEELNDFLPPAHRKVSFTHSFRGRGSVKDMIESLGVPHTEIDVILVNGVSVDFSCIVRDGDRVSVYPVFESLDITPLVRLRPRPLRETRFVLDTHLGRLARYLRLLGFDTLYRNDYTDDDLARISVGQKRIILTRDRLLLKRGIITHGYCIRSPEPMQQTREILERFDLFNSVAPFTRCLRCNGILEPIEKKLAADRLPPRARQYHDEFNRCISCDRIYWRGTHYEALRALVDQFLGNDRRGVK